MLRLEIFTNEELDLLHESSLQILEKTGVVMQDSQILNLFDKAGAEVDKKEQLVKIPSELVNEKLKKVPANINLYYRDKEKSLNIGINGKLYFTTGGAVPFVLDPENHRRIPNTQDAINRIRLIDALDSIDSIETSPGVWPQDIPAYLRDVFVTVLTFENTDKHYGIETVGPPQAQRYSIKIAEVIAGGKDELRKKPIIHGSAERIGPLFWDEHALGNLILYAKHGLLVDISAPALTGLTSPTTLVGAVVHGNAGFLSGVVAAQLINEGTPVGRFGSGTVTDLKTGKATMGSVGYSLLTVATGQISRYYKLPSMGIGGIPDTNSLDMQCGYETALTMMLAALGGVNRVQTGGLLAGATITSLEKLMIDDEIIKMVKHALDGIKISTERMGLDIIHELGPHGNFMTNKQALIFNRKYLRTEHFVPSLSLRIDWDQWIKKGKRTVVDISKRRAKELLRSHEPVPLAKDLRKDIREILENARKKLAP